MLPEGPIGLSVLPVLKPNYFISKNVVYVAKVFIELSTENATNSLLRASATKHFYATYHVNEYSYRTVMRLIAFSGAQNERKPYFTVLTIQRG